VAFTAVCLTVSVLSPSIALTYFTVLISALPSDSKSYIGFVSDGAVLAHLSTSAEQVPGLSAYLSHPLDALALPSLYLYNAVVSASHSASVLDAMCAMSEQGVSSVAVLDDSCGGALLSAVSVTDIGKVN
jgi:CBS domain-containing protein